MDIPQAVIVKTKRQAKRHQQTETTKAESVRRCYTLDELLAQCDMNAPMVTEKEVWGNLRPVGKEVW